MNCPAASDRNAATRRPFCSTVNPALNGASHGTSMRQTGVRSFVRAAERQILAPPRDAPDGNHAEMLADRAHHLDAGFGEGIHTAVFIDHHSVRVRDRLFLSSPRAMAQW